MTPQTTVSDALNKRVLARSGKGPRGDRSRQRKQSETGHRRARVDQLETDVRRSLQAMGAELGALRKLTQKQSPEGVEERLEDLQKRVKDLEEKATSFGRRLGGVKAQLKTQHGTVKEFRTELDELKELAESLLAGMEDVRAQLDELHLNAAKKRSFMSTEIGDEWKVGHVVLGAAAAGSYVGAATLINKLTGEQVLPLSIPVVAAALAAGISAFEVASEAA